jgi:tetratricopeptide (TPR) repeat protein
MSKTKNQPNVIVLFLHIKGISKALQEGDYISVSKRTKGFFTPLAERISKAGGGLLSIEKEVILAVFGGKGYTDATPVHAATAAQDVLTALQGEFRGIQPTAYLCPFRVNMTHLRRDGSNLPALAPGIQKTKSFLARLPRATRVLLSPEMVEALPPGSRTELYRGGKQRLFKIHSLPRKKVGPFKGTAFEGTTLVDFLDKILAPMRALAPAALSVLDLRFHKKGGKDTEKERQAWKRIVKDLPANIEACAARWDAEVAKRSKTHAILLFRAHSPAEDAPLRAVAASLDFCTRADSLAKSTAPSGRLFCMVATTTGSFKSLEARQAKGVQNAIRQAAALLEEALADFPILDKTTADCVKAHYHLSYGINARHALVMDIHRRTILAAEVDDGTDTGPAGRPAEMGLIRKALNQLSDSGKGMVFTLMGEKGAGKTRLAFEALKLASEKGVRAYYGSCDPDRLYAPFLPVKEALSAMAGLNPFNDGTPENRKLSEWLIRNIPIHADTLHKAFRVLFHIPGKKNPVDDYVPRLKLGIITKSILTFFEAESRRSPMLLIFENLHLAVRDTFDLVARIENLARTCPIVVMKTTVPTVRIPMGSGETRKTLKDLTPNHVTKLARNLLGARNLGNQLQKYLHGLQAYPGVIREAIEQLRASGRLSEKNGRWDFTRKKDHNPRIDPRVPRRRLLDEMPKMERKVLEWAAFLGPTFSVKALALLGGKKDDVLGALAALQETGAIRLMQARGNRVFGFPDPLLFSLVVDGVEKGRARQLHRKVADALLEAHKDRIFEHMDRVVHNLRGTPQKKQLGEFLIQGAIHAKGSAMAGLAEEYFSEATELFKKDRVHDAWLRFELAGLLCQIGDTDKALEHLKKALSRLGKSSEIRAFDERIDQADEEDDDEED